MEGLKTIQNGNKVLADLEQVPADLLTIILTTSPVPSSPSPQLVKNTIQSLPSCFKGVPIILTFDNFSVVPEDRLKKGRVSQPLADTYPEYIQNVKNLFGDASTFTEEEERSEYFESHGPGVTFLRLKLRFGFAFSVKAALDNVKTPFVFILQHDWLFTQPHPPILKLLSILKDESNDVQNIGFIARMSKDYVNSRSHLTNFKHVFQEAQELRKGRPLEGELMACLHWFDRPHFCSTETYKKIFSLGILHRGDFIEDTFGTKYLAAIQHADSHNEAFLKWKEFGPWLYYPNDGKDVAVKHGSGRTNLLGARQEERVQNYIKESQIKSERYQNRDLNKKNDVNEEDIDDIAGFLNEEELE